MFIIAMILAVIGLIALIAGIVMRRRSIFAPAPGVGILFLAALFVIFSCLTQVPAQGTGVITKFGKTTGHVFGPGLHWKSPFEKVTDMDGTMQQVDNEGSGATAVRLNTNSVMYVQNNLRWKILPNAAPQLFRDWKKFDHIQNGLITKELVSALNVELADYDALDPAKQGQSTDELEKKVIDRLNSRIGRDAPDPEINIVTFTIQRIDFDKTTQARLNQYQQEVAKTRTAEQHKKTVTAEAAANRELAASVSHDPNVLVNKCLDIQQTAVEKGMNPSFSCWPINGATVTTPAKTAK